MSFPLVREMRISPVTQSRTAVLALIVAIASGCCPFSVTAISESELCKDKKFHHAEGIPFYLPKPLLVISKNFYYIEEAKVGLTQPPPIPNLFDNQANFASLNATASISTNGAAPPAAADGSKPPGARADDPPPPPKPDSCCSTQVLHSGQSIPMAPDCSKQLSVGKPFFTYQILFVPDLTQKHFLRIKGGPGEVRAAMNLVNGWMYTGLGPFYLKDSSTAQNILATGVLAKFAGSGAADVINSVANLSKAFQQSTPNHAAAAMREVSLYAQAASADIVPEVTQCIQAEIHVFEPTVTSDGLTEWREINPAATNFEGHWLGAKELGAKALDKKMAVHTDAAAMMNQIIAQEPGIRAAEAAAEAPARAIFAAQTMNALTNPAVVAGEHAVALQTLAAPPPPKPRCALLDWICGRFRRSQTVNKEANGPTSATQP
jgi:hypothetical protein